MMMVEAGDADGVIAGLRAYYPATIKPALQIIKTRPGVKKVSGAYLLMFKGRMLDPRRHDREHRSDRRGPRGDRRC